MLKLFKYIFYANVYKRAKKSFITLLLAMFTLIVGLFMFSDLTSISTGVALYSLLLVKWVFVISLLALIAFHTLKIVNVIMEPLGSSTEKSRSSEEVQADAKKERVLNKEQIFTKSEMILQKYMKD